MVTVTEATLGCCHMMCACETTEVHSHFFGMLSWLLECPGTMCTVSLHIFCNAAEDHGIGISESPFSLASFWKMASISCQPAMQDSSVAPSLKFGLCSFFEGKPSAWGWKLFPLFDGN